jgi:hypothetical protein
LFPALSSPAIVGVLTSIVIECRGGCYAFMERPCDFCRAAIRPALFLTFPSPFTK